MMSGLRPATGRTRVQQQRIAQFKARGYVTVFADNGFVVMHAPNAGLGTGDIYER